MIQTATANFEDRLQRIDARMESLVSGLGSDPEPEAAQETAAEVQKIQEERLSTEKCLQICTQLSHHINQLRLSGRQRFGAGTATPSDSESVPERITNEGLDECADSLSRMIQKLACHEQTLFTRLADAMAGSSLSGKNVAEVARLREEWVSTHGQMGALYKIGQKLEDTVSQIQNHATGDALQVMVSADGKPLRGTNKATGQGIQLQAGGLMSNETIQIFLREGVRMSLAKYGDRVSSKEHAGKINARVANSSPERAKSRSTKDVREENSDESQFEDLYGEGYTLACESPTSSKAEKKNQQG